MQKGTDTLSLKLLDRIYTTKTLKTSCRYPGRINPE
jgi:hypothetical protein